MMPKKSVHTETVWPVSLLVEISKRKWDVTPDVRPDFPDHQSAGYIESDVCDEEDDKADVELVAFEVQVGG